VTAAVPAGDGGATYCADCDSQMVSCPWGGLDCPECDKGHHAGPDWVEPFSNVRELLDRSGKPQRPWEAS